LTGLRFGFITTFYPPYNFGGDGIAVQRLARALVKWGHRVTVVHDVDAYNVLRAQDESAPPSSSDDGVEVIGLRSRLGALAPLLTHQLGRPLVNRRRILELLDQRQFDVINYHNISLIGGPEILAYGSALKLYMAHDHWLVCPTNVLWRHRRELCSEQQCLRCMLHYRRPPQLYRWTGLLDRRLEHVDVFIAGSEFSRRKHYEFGFPKQMEVLPYFLPAPETTTVATNSARPHQSPYFLFVGRLEDIKGADDLVIAIRDYPDADLLIAGEGGSRTSLEALSSGLDRVKFLGQMTEQDLRIYYRHALALIVPSRCFEVFPLVLIEAFRESTPVIARRLGPLPENVGLSGGGELFANREELLAAMKRVQQEPEYRNRLGRAGYETYISCWSDRVVIPQYLQIVRRAAEARQQIRVMNALAN
jgi:glycosyltransferase involved in cell wall biosynthesis